jgi:3-oxoacyl-[acyl-carrier protein] reductase
MFDLTGATALVTGAARGIGAACAKRLAEAGGKVIIHYHTSAAAADATMRALGPSGLAKVSADLSDTGAARKLAEDVMSGHPEVNLLINNAGVYETMRFIGGKAEELIAHWRRLLDVNVMSAVALSNVFARHFARNGGGKIINIASRAAFRGEAGGAAYAASKAVLVTLTKSLAAELAGDGVYVYAIAPGWTETEMVLEQPAAKREAAVASIPFGRMAAPEEIGACAAFLASKEADYLTGITIDANGASYFR